MHIAHHCQLISEQGGLETDRRWKHEALCIAWSDLQGTATADDRLHIAGVHSEVRARWPQNER